MLSKVSTIVGLSRRVIYWFVHYLRSLWTDSPSEEFSTISSTETTSHQSSIKWQLKIQLSPYKSNTRKSSTLREPTKWVNSTTESRSWPNRPQNPPELTWESYWMSEPETKSKKHQDHYYHWRIPTTKLLSTPTKQSTSNSHSQTFLFFSGIIQMSGGDFSMDYN